MYKYFNKKIKLKSDGVDIGILLTDFYLLTRIFKEFDMSGLKNRGPLKCKENKNKNLNNIVIYAGNLHAMVYKDFLLKYYPDSLQFSTESNFVNQIMFGKVSVKKNILGFTNFNQLITDFSENKKQELENLEIFLSKIDDNYKIVTKYRGFTYAIILFNNILYLVSDYFYQNTDILLSNIDKKDLKILLIE